MSSPAVGPLARAKRDSHGHSAPQVRQYKRPNRSDSQSDSAGRQALASSIRRYRPSQIPIRGNAPAVPGKLARADCPRRCRSDGKHCTERCRLAFNDSDFSIFVYAVSQEHRTTRIVDRRGGPGYPAESRPSDTARSCRLRKSGLQLSHPSLFCQAQRQALEHADLWLISVGSHHPDRGHLAHGTEPLSHGQQKSYAVITPDARMLNGEVVDETLSWAALADDESAAGTKSNVGVREDQARQKPFMQTYRVLSWPQSFSLTI